MPPVHGQRGWEEITDKTDQRVGLAKLQGLQREHINNRKPWWEDQGNEFRSAPEFGRGMAYRGEGRSGRRDEEGAGALKVVFFQARTRPEPRGRARPRPLWDPPP